MFLGLALGICAAVGWANSDVRNSLDILHPLHLCLCCSGNHHQGLLLREGLRLLVGDNQVLSRKSVQDENILADPETCETPGRIQPCHEHVRVF